jgi:cob(I)alamin adenosyltransferase
MKIYTGTGDNGTTGLLGGERSSKSSVRLHACGTLDELNAAMGLALSSGNVSPILQNQIGEIQCLLFTIGADIATPHKTRLKISKIGPEETSKIEKWIDKLSSELPELKNFILPGGSSLGAHLHLARTVCRRAERWIVALNAQEPVNENIIPFMNRLSDYLFTAARFANKEANREETKVTIPKADV